MGRADVDETKESHRVHREKTLSIKTLQPRAKTFNVFGKPGEFSRV
jgi:hypothetical protein